MQQHPPFAANERGPGDDPPPRAAGRGRRRAIVSQRGTATQPKVTKRLLRVNYSPGRPGVVDMITDHVTEGTAASVLSWFNNPSAEASAHYMVRKSSSSGGPFADIDQFVEEQDRAWHCGRVRNPIAKLVRERPTRNPNAYSIGIEHEGKGTEELTPQQRASSLWLHRDIQSRHPAIEFDRKHVVGHREIFSLKTCPGGIDVDRIVRELLGEDGEVFTPRIVWSAYFRDYLIVTRIESNTEWYFVRAKSAANMEQTRAQTPLSDMPPLQPGT